MVSRLSIRLLGPFRAAIDGDAITGFRSDKVRALLGYLCVESNMPHRRERLAGLLWPDFPERSARSYLRVALANLRQVLGDQQAAPPYLLISRQTIQFNLASDAWIDVISLLSLLQSSRPTIQVLESTVELYLGDFMAGFSLADSPAFEEWALLTREQLHRKVLEALHRLARSLERQGDYEQALVYGWRQVDLDPWREAAHRQVMRLLAQSGQRSAALAQFESCRKVLREELGVGVSAQTRELYERLKRGEVAEGATAVVPRHNLPAQATSFEGREEELDKIDQLLGDPSCRLLTLLGPGGIGKTRLALEAAAREVRAFADGVFFVPLAFVPSPEFVVAKVADALRLPPDTIGSDLDSKTHLLDYLRERSVLLLMDNFEQLVEGSGLLADLMGQAPYVKLLVTSRERLHLRGEWVLDVGGMRYPDNGDEDGIDDYEAPKLFLARARQADSRFVLSAEERPHVDAICRLLEGMPLGIELAAAWVPVLSCREIASEIETGIGILASPTRDGAGRHCSLRAAFDRSWRLLTEEARAGFCRLSVFHGGLCREAAMAVAGVDLSLLSELVNKSLLRRNTQGRYEIHELLRQYAAEKLDRLPGQEEEAMERHSRYYVGFLSARERDLFGERLTEIKGEVRVEIENVRAGIRWAVSHWSEAEARDALASLDALWVVESWHEGQETFADIAQSLQRINWAEVGTGTPKGSLLPTAQVYQALYSSLLGESDAAERILRDCMPVLLSLRPLGVERELAVGFFGRGVNAFCHGDMEESRALFEESVSVARSCQDGRWVANGLMWLGWVLSELGDHETAKARCEESYSLYRELGNRWGMAFVLGKQGLVADGQRDYRQAERYHKKALEILSGFGDRAGEAYETSRLSWTVFGGGRYAEARQLGRHGYELFEEIGHRWGMGASLCRIGFAALGLKRKREARTCFLEALELANSLQHVPLMLYSLAGTASLLAEEGKEAQAVELFTFVQEHPQTPPTYLDGAERWFSDIETRLPCEALSEARERGGAGELDALVEAALRDRLAE